MSNEPREVIGVGGEIAILGPNDKLIVRLPAHSISVANDVAKGLNTLIPGRSIVLAGDIEITVAREGD